MIESRQVHRIVGCVALLAIVSAAPAVVLSQQRPSDNDAALVLPVRRTLPSLPSEPPGLPLAADRLVPLTLQVRVHRKTTNRAETAEQTISRTVDRVHVRARDGEWLFERNVRDRRRVSAHLIDHAARTIVAYEETDLRMTLGLRGWADVLMLGFDPSMLEHCTRSGRVRTTGGIRFHEYSNRETDRGVVWWNEDQLLSSTFDVPTPTGITTVTVHSIRQEIEATLLQPAQVRFPDYRLVDLASWQEHR